MKQSEPGNATDQVTATTVGTYETPKVTIVEFKAEKGFANSLDNYPDGGDAW